MIGIDFLLLFLLDLQFVLQFTVVMKVSSILLTLTTFASTTVAFVVPSTRNAMICSTIGMAKQNNNNNNKNTNINIKINNSNNKNNKSIVDDNDEDAIYVADFMSKMTAQMDEEVDDDYNNNEYDDDDDDELDDDEPTSRRSTLTKSNNPSSSTLSSRWDQLSPMAKSRLQKEAVDKKLANNREESKADKKRRTWD